MFVFCRGDELNRAGSAQRRVTWVLDRLAVAGDIGRPLENLVRYQALDVDDRCLPRVLPEPQSELLSALACAPALKRIRLN
jgi:hypothetical protein